MTKVLSDTLKFQIIEKVFDMPQYQSELKKMVANIHANSQAAKNEATVATQFEMLLYSFIQTNLNLHILPEKEIAVDTEIHITKGRIDSRIGALVIEYKHHTKLKSKKQQQSATKQIKYYLKSLSKGQKGVISGLITDGLNVQFISLDESGKFSESLFSPLSDKYLDRIIRNIVLLYKTALTPDNLVKNFCNDKIAKELSTTLFDALKNNITGRSQMLFNEWKALFKLAHDDTSKQTAIKARRKSLEEAFDIEFPANDNDTEYMALFALQTAYAIIIKVVAYKVISTISPEVETLPFSAISNRDSDALRSRLARLEDGDIFRELGFGNLLEGDFFAWYSTPEQWSDAIFNSVRQVFVILAEYEEHQMFDGELTIQDLFKDLYMGIIPDKVRHSLGEFYTPPWLADNVIAHGQNLINKDDWSALDPCCGSGTFLTTLIKRCLDSTGNLSNSDKLQNILRRVKGMDLNPLAVLSSRINYFINISPLIEGGVVFEIPVYLGDASYVPQRIKIDGVSCLEYKIATLKGDLEIIIPVSATSDSLRFSQAMTMIEAHISNLDEDGVSQELFDIIDDNDKKDNVIKNIKLLSRSLVDLERNDWNGIWARIITNFLTTANMGKFDLVVGNPPWIDWKNLPINYRER